MEQDVSYKCYSPDRYVKGKGLDIAGVTIVTRIHPYYKNHYAKIGLREWQGNRKEATKLILNGRQKKVMPCPVPVS